MPKYTARVFTTRKDVIQEEIWLEDIRAKGEKQATNATNTRMRQYLEQHRGIGDKPITGYIVGFVMRSDLLNSDKIAEIRKKPIAEKAALMSPPAKGNSLKLEAPPKVINAKIVNLRLNKKMFKKEIKGDFCDPYTFPETLALRVRVPPHISAFGFRR